MQKFEYKILDLPASGTWTGSVKVDLQQLTTTLNELGRQGWEIVNGMDINRAYGATIDVIIILKRPLTDNE